MDPFCVNLDLARLAHPRLNGVLPENGLRYKDVQYLEASD